MLMIATDFEHCYVKLKIRYQGSIKTLLCSNFEESLEDLSSGDEKSNANRLLKVVFTDILS